MSITAVPSVAAAPVSTGGTAAAQQPHAPANPRTDTVQLTEAQQVYQLYEQGQHVPQIAGKLDLTVAAVNSYLNLSSSSS